MFLLHESKNFQVWQPYKRSTGNSGHWSIYFLRGPAVIMIELSSGLTALNQTLCPPSPGGNTRKKGIRNFNRGNSRLRRPSVYLTFDSDELICFSGQLRAPRFNLILRF